MTKEKAINLPLTIVFCILIIIPTSLLFFSEKHSTTILNEHILKERIKKEDGFRKFGQMDSNKNLISGYGHRAILSSGKKQKTDNLTKQEALDLFDSDFKFMKEVIIELTGLKMLKLNLLPEGIISALCDMTFYLGKTEMEKMDSMWRALQIGNFHLAAKTLFLSQFAKSDRDYAFRTVFNSFLMMTNWNGQIASTELSDVQKEKINSFMVIETSRTDHVKNKHLIIMKYNYKGEKECLFDMFFEKSLGKCLDRLHCQESNYIRAQRFIVENHKCIEIDQNFYTDGVKPISCPIDTFTTPDDNICHTKEDCRTDQRISIDRFYIEDHECKHCGDGKIQVNNFCVDCPKETTTLISQNECTSIHKKFST